MLPKVWVRGQHKSLIQQKKFSKIEGILRKQSKIIEIIETKTDFQLNFNGFRVERIEERVNRPGLRS